LKKWTSGAFRVLDLTPDTFARKAAGLVAGGLLVTYHLKKNFPANEPTAPAETMLKVYHRP